MGIFSVLSGKDSSSSVLKAIITFDDNNNASVRFEKLHPEVPDFEYVKIILMMYAKMLYNLDPNSSESLPASELLIKAMEDIASAKLNRSSNILKIANIDDVARYADPKGKTFVITSTLFAPSGTIRHISTDMPRDISLQQTIFSVPVLIQGVVGVVAVDEIQILQRALANMSQQYRNGFDYSNLQTWSSVPNNAFFSSFSSSADDNSNMGRLLRLIKEDQNENNASLDLAAEPKTLPAKNQKQKPLKKIDADKSDWF